MGRVGLGGGRGCRVGTSYERTEYLNFHTVSTPLGLDRMNWVLPMFSHIVL